MTTEEGIKRWGSPTWRLMPTEMKSFYCVLFVIIFSISNLPMCNTTIQSDHMPTWLPLSYISGDCHCIGISFVVNFKNTFYRIKIVFVFKINIKIKWFLKTNLRYFHIFFVNYFKNNWTYKELMENFYIA